MGVGMKKLLVVCATIVLLSGIGAWTYIQEKNIEQKDQQAKSQQELDIKKLKYQECETTDRQVYAKPTIGSDLLVKNCDLIF